MSAADLFVSPPSTYLLSHSVGLPLLDVVENGHRDAMAAWTQAPATAWTSWLNEVGTFRAALAELFSTTPDAICPQTNVSSGLTKWLDALPGHRPTILLTEEAFPSVGYVCRQAGAEVRFIPRSADATDPGVWEAHLTPEIDVAVITHVHSNTGELLPTADIVPLAKAVDIRVVVDVAQSAGVIPIDLTLWDADAVVGSCVKWLCGGPGAGFLWVHPEHFHDLEPHDVGWFSHRDPFTFDIHDFSFAPDALRFWGGTPSVFPAALAARAVAGITSIGVPTIRAHNLALTDRLIAGAEAMIASPSSAQIRSGTVIVRADAATQQLLAAFSEAGIDVDARPTGIRISPHIYNTEDHIDATLEVLNG